MSSKLALIHTTLSAKMGISACCDLNSICMMSRLDQLHNDLFSSRMRWKCIAFPVLWNGHHCLIASSLTILTIHPTAPLKCPILYQNNLIRHAVWNIVMLFDLIKRMWFGMRNYSSHCIWRSRIIVRVRVCVHETRLACVININGRSSGVNIA